MKFGKKAKERLITLLQQTTLDTNQEKKLQAKDLKGAMLEVYFSQLKVVILKDWSSYQPVFLDRVKFEQFFDVVNTFRVDAHAKELDEEEEGLLNLSFRFFEKALSDV